MQPYSPDMPPEQGDEIELDDGRTGVVKSVYPRMFKRGQAMDPSNAIEAVFVEIMPNGETEQIDHLSIKNIKRNPDPGMARRQSALTDDERKFLENYAAKNTALREEEDIEGGRRRRKRKTRRGKAKRQHRKTRVHRRR